MFNIKQIESVNVRPLPEERQAFLNIFDKFNDGDDSVESDRQQMMSLLKNESDVAFDFNEKIYVTKGDLQSMIGIIQSFNQGGQLITFKPIGPDFKDVDITFEVQRDFCIKYFDSGDAV